VGADDVMGKFHRRFVPELHWYLLIVGVDPELQGRGLGSALFKEGLAKADESNCPCNLDTSEERNFAFLSARELRGRRNRSARQGRTTWMGDATQRTRLKGDSVMTRVAADGC
jgi:GNAT superfamily N-acetyltransferase